MDHVRVEAVRVPYFHYACAGDTGMLLLDSSGHDHHGYLGGEGFGGGHLGYTGYRHEHTPLTGISPPPEDLEGSNIPEFRQDADGEGYLHFNGESYVMIMGGTAFPHASTYEMYLKPEPAGQRQGVLGAANGSINIYITGERTIEASRGGVRIESQKSLPAGTWTHIAVTYDLEKLHLYIDGVLQAVADVAPNRSFERINPVVLGGTCGFPFIPQPAFVGGVRNVRFYGRNLQPQEFLVK